MSEALPAAPAAALANRELASRLAWSSLVIACFLAARPYLGVVHDAIQYTAQALAHLDPEIYRKDVYFGWGSQDQYTLFSPLYALLLPHLGLASANLTLVLASLAFFLGASYVLVRSLLPAHLHGFSMVLIAASAGHYGPQRIFRMAEAFVSPRPIAEAGTLLAMWLLFRGRRYAAFVVLAACALLHPLVALTGVMYWWLYVFLGGGDRRLLAGLALVPVAAALAGVAPFTQLFTAFDAEWFERVYEMNRHLFLTHWVLQDWSRLAFDFAALYMAAQLSDTPLRAVFRAGMLTAVAALGVTFVGADILHDVLLINVQPWRALWLVHWLALAATPIVASRLWMKGETGRLVTGLLLFGFVTRGLPTSLGASLLGLALFAGRTQLALAPRMVTVLLGALSAGALASWISADHALFRSPLFPVGSAEIPILRVLSRPFPIAVLALAVYWFALRRRAAWLGLLAAVSLLLLSLASWDQRSPFARYVEASTPGQHPLSRIVAPGQQVWWHGEDLGDGRSLILPWILMERASYVSAFQHVGQHFDRATTLELHRRDELVLPFSMQASLCGVVELMNPNEKCQPEFDSLQDLCRDAKGLDYLILEADYPGKWIAAWSPPVEIAGRVPRFHLYACKSIVAR